MPQGDDAARPRRAGTHGTTRRVFLRRSGLAVVAAGALGSGLGWPEGASAASVYTDRETWDAWHEQFYQRGGDGQPDEPNDASAPSGKSGNLGWGQSYVLASLVNMYEAYRDTRYLDRLIENTDAVLSVRDSERGVTDYSGKSLPAWRATHPYTVGTVTLSDDQGRPALEVRLGDVYCDTGTVTVSPGATPGTFNLSVFHGYRNRRATYSGLTMDPSSPNYAVRRIYAAYPGTVLTTVRDLRATPAAAGDPVPGTYPFKSLASVFAVHTGMITYPIASFVRLVRQSPNLRNNPRYSAKADEYLQAVRDAVAVHDPEWRESATGEGYLIWLKGSAQQWDGSPLPINMTLSWGQAVAELAVITGEDEYRHKTRAMAKMLRGEFAVDAGDAYSWHYWPTFGNQYKGYAKTGSPETDISVYNPSLSTVQRQVDDISHGAISVEFAVRAFRANLGMGGRDMARLARTFTQNVATVDAAGLASAHARLDGTGAGGTNFTPQTPRFMPLAPFDEQVYRHSLAVYDDTAPTPESLGALPGWLLNTVAYLHLYARTGTAGTA